jgi:hypothetical protein
MFGALLLYSMFNAIARAAASPSLACNCPHHNAAHPVPHCSSTSGSTNRISSYFFLSALVAVCAAFEFFGGASTSTPPFALLLLLLLPPPPLHSHGGGLKGLRRQRGTFKMCVTFCYIFEQ